MEPLVIFVGYPYFFLIPAWISLGIYNRWFAPQASSSFMRLLQGHPLATLYLTGLVVCTVWDGVLEALFVRMEIYSYTQVIGRLTFRSGTTWQFPLYEAPLFGILLACAPLLMWRDASGCTDATRLARRWRLMQSRPNAGPAAAAFVVMLGVYVGYGMAYAGLRATGSASTVARPWAYQDVKVYDPQGAYRRSGQLGPFFPGIWSGWESGRGRRGGRP